ncbi:MULTISPECIES: response regulator transcription factor [Streptomyces]|nr:MULTISPECIES: response regulator transcription factor [Streptomyces]MCM9082425.1 response regulator transcription factor [Streptomyces spororaveus]MCX4957517.1 response regulator transcription factor [Streptomyces virginiae]MCX5176259.1 response regulator transcription factor [Streptomyces virginiae]MCX5303000.1 response regulator transcription factor [Streptomyces sp. NBC_00160]
MVSVLIAEDMLMLRRALVSLLELEPDIEVVAEVANGLEILPQAQKHRPDVVVLDIDLPGMDGITAAYGVSRELPGCGILMLTNLHRTGNLRRALAAGASGFLHKDTDPDRLVASIRAVAEGRQVVDPELALAALQDGPQPLTPRELEVLRLAAEGEEAAQIAVRLFLSAGTVRNYLTNAVTKLGARNRVDAVRIAREAGWL